MCGIGRRGATLHLAQHQQGWSYRLRYAVLPARLRAIPTALREDTAKLRTRYSEQLAALDDRGRNAIQSNSRESGTQLDRLEQLSAFGETPPHPPNHKPCPLSARAAEFRRSQRPASPPNRTARPSVPPPRTSPAGVPGATVNSSKRHSRIAKPAAGPGRMRTPRRPSGLARSAAARAAVGHTRATTPPLNSAECSPSRKLHR